MSRIAQNYLLLSAQTSFEQPAKFYTITCSGSVIAKVLDSNTNQAGILYVKK